ncbi:Predicted N-acetyltransferase YhbS [Paenibacillus uliginis N3/975]|uniref:Predicted N-acetyltransferase YhbS n=1 Tax=Paenibacillus uliginis N3/975 TaxID=1313296 RepID=A0A1X7HPE5_9BACL|nr:GNAT family N-acetyltransferase [Paenibacillus uliginis]SMF89553.1 Predicted N-acetyltransferase YhbS [Paenibacillus uliginis N3/975]
MNIKLMESQALNQAVELSDRIFLKQPEQPSMGQSFPMIFEPGISHSYGAFDAEGKVTAFMGLVPFTIRTEAAMLKTFSIGSVCTDPDSRGKGLAGELLNQCKAHAERSGASLIFISGARSLYTRAACRHFGRAMQYRLTPQDTLQLKGKLQGPYQVREMTPDDIFKVHGLIEKRTAAYVSSANELDKLLGASAFSNVIRLEQKVLVAEQNGTLVAFAIIGVPGTTMTPSRPATLIEWAGHDEAAAYLLSEAFDRYGLQELIVALPWQDRELSVLLEAAGSEVQNTRNSGTLYLVNGRELLRQIAPMLPEEAAGILQAEGDHGPYLYKQDGETVILDDEGLLSLLFDPESPHRTTIAEAGDTVVHGFTLRPIPLPYTEGLQYI